MIEGWNECWILLDSHVSFQNSFSFMLRRGIQIASHHFKAQNCLYSTKSLNVVFFGSDAVSNPTLQLLYNDYLRDDGLIKNLEV